MCNIHWQTSPDPAEDDVTLAGTSDTAECKRVRLQNHKQEALKRYLLL